VRLERNAASKLVAEHDGQTWTDEELEWLRTWDGTEEYLVELGVLLGRTIEGCRQQYYISRRTGRWTARSKSTMEYRGWTEADGDGWT
jgi:hypothetical protein